MKRKSVLNCELFTVERQRQRTGKVLEKLHKVLGINIDKDKQLG